MHHVNYIPNPNSVISKACACTRVCNSTQVCQKKNNSTGLVRKQPFTSSAHPQLISHARDLHRAAQYGLPLAPSLGYRGISLTNIA